MAFSILTSCKKIQNDLKETSTCLYHDRHGQNTILPFSFYGACVKCYTLFCSKRWRSWKTLTLHACSCQSCPRGPKLGPFQHEVLRSRTAATQRRASSAESWEEFALVPILPVCSRLRDVQPAFVSPGLLISPADPVLFTFSSSCRASCTAHPLHGGITL